MRTLDQSIFVSLASKRVLPAYQRAAIHYGRCGPSSKAIMFAGSINKEQDTSHIRPTTTFVAMAGRQSVAAQYLTVAFWGRARSVRVTD